MRFFPAIVDRPEEVQVKERRAQSICSMQKKKRLFFSKHVRLLAKPLNNKK